jgi:mannose/fructose/N-acetylgalactosamine-specific phosphotransferase system component IID
MWIVAIAWMFVVLLMSVAEAVSPVGSVLGAIVTFFLYGVGPLALVMYLLGTPMRRQARRAAEALADQAAMQADLDAAALQPDAGDLPAGDAISPERKEP